MITKKRWILVATVAAVTFGAIGFFLQSKRQNSSLVGTVKKGSIIEAVYAIGTVTANRSYTLKVAIASNVNQVYVREGDFVSKGQNLIQLADTPVFRSPFDGTVTSVNYKIGETVAPQSQIVSVVDMKDRYLIANLEQQGAIKVTKGQNVRLSFEALRDKTFYGKTEVIYVKDGQFTVRISGNNLPESILPGMTVDVAIEISKKESALLAPTSGLTKGNFTKIVGKSQIIVPVKVGLMDGERVEILEGDLQENDQVLLGGAK